MNGFVVNTCNAESALTFCVLIRSAVASERRRSTTLAAAGEAMTLRSGACMHSMIRRCIWGSLASAVAGGVAVRTLTHGAAMEPSSCPTWLRVLRCLLWGVGLPSNGVGDAVQVKRRPPRRTDKAKASMGDKLRKRRDKAFIRRKGKFARKGRNMRKT